MKTPVILVALCGAMLFITHFFAAAQAGDLFQMQQLDGCAPANVFFHNVVNGAAAYHWDFGDGRTSADRNPLPVWYDEPGTYELSLTITTRPGQRRIAHLRVLSVPGNWREIFTDNRPDLYARVYDNERNLLNRGSVAHDRHAPVDLSIAVLLDSGVYQLEIWDYDLIGNDDYLGVVRLDTRVDSDTLTSGRLSLVYSLTDVEAQMTDTRTVRVGRPFITADGDRLTANVPAGIPASTAGSYRWFRDGELLGGYVTPTITAPGPGVYTVEVNQSGCDGRSYPFTHGPGPDPDPGPGVGIEPLTVVFGEEAVDINRPNKIIALGEGLFLIGGEWNGQATLLKVNCRGAILLRRSYGDLLGGASTIVDLWRDDDGSIVVTGECSECDGAGKRIFLFRVNTRLETDATTGAATFHASYDDAGPLVNNDYCSPCLLAEKDHYYLIASQTVAGSSYTDALLLKLDRDFRTVWAKTYNGCGNCGFDTPASLAKTPAGWAMLVYNNLGDSLTVWQLDLHGEVRWKKRLANDGGRLRRMIYHPGGRLILGGSGRRAGGADADLLLLALDAATGDPLDALRFGDSLNDQLGDLRVLDNGDLLAGALFPQPNSLGAYQTSRVYHLSADPLDVAGEAHRIPNPSTITGMTLTSLLPLTADGAEFVAVGRRGFHHRTFFHAVSTCTETFVDNDGDGYPAGVDCDDDNPGVHPDATEISGNNVDENCDGNVLVGVHTQAPGEVIRLYPNPTLDAVFLDGDFSQRVRLDVYSPAGLLIRQAVVDPGDSGPHIRLGGLPPGLYLVRVADAEGRLLMIRPLVKI